jgi:hypothetical protein
MKKLKSYYKITYKEFLILLAIAHALTVAFLFLLPHATRWLLLNIPLYVLIFIPSAVIFSIWVLSYCLSLTQNKLSYGQLISIRTFQKNVS